MTQLSSKLKDTDEILARKEEMLDMETRRLKLAQKRLDDIKAQQKEMKRKRDSLKDAKNKFEKQESEATNRADNLKVHFFRIVDVVWRSCDEALCGNYSDSGFGGHGFLPQCADAVDPQSKISDSRDSLKDTKDDIDKRGACSIFCLVMSVA